MQVFRLPAENACAARGRCNVGLFGQTTIKIAWSGDMQWNTGGQTRILATAQGFALARRGGFAEYSTLSRSSLAMSRIESRLLETSRNFGERFDGTFA